MEFGERGRRRKSQSFKVVTGGDFDPSYLVNSSCTDANEECKDAAVTDVWLEDEGREIKRQITGMRRLLNDKAGRVYQRVGAEGDSLKKEPQDQHLSWAHQSAALPENHQINWNTAGVPGPSPSSIPVSNGQGYSQYITCSKALRISNNTQALIKNKDVNEVAPPTTPEAPCCMCNCKGTLQAILQELQAMRRLMQTQKASLEKQEPTAPTHQHCLSPPPTPHRRARKRRPIFKMSPLAASTRKAAASTLTPSLFVAEPLQPGMRESHEAERGRPTPSPISTELSTLSLQKSPSASIAIKDTHVPLFSQPSGLESLESEVRLAEDYEVFIPKAQLDSILVNYTRSGSLLFRKLVCAFFDDATLANSLPNGKRKRGINDNRKGLDQNIVGAIKVFTEKYCTAHRIEKLPGPRDWVQILQDQIKLARRRLKRDAVDAENATDGPCISHDHNKSADVAEAVENVTG